MIHRILICNNKGGGGVSIWNIKVFPLPPLSQMGFGVPNFVNSFQKNIWHVFFCSFIRRLFFEILHCTETIYSPSTISYLGKVINFLILNVFRKRSLYAMLSTGRKNVLINVTWVSKFITLTQFYMHISHLKIKDI